VGGHFTFLTDSQVARLYIKIYFKCYQLTAFRKHIVQCYGHLTTSDHQLYRVTPLKTSFRLVLPLLQSQTTRNYNHSQLFLTLCHIYTAYHHTLCNYNHLSHSYTFALADFSAINIVSNYHRLYSFTLRNSRRDLTPRIHLLRLLLNN
jgi:hypothetical protein